MVISFLIRTNISSNESKLDYSHITYLQKPARGEIDHEKFKIQIPSLQRQSNDLLRDIIQPSEIKIGVQK